MERQKMIDKSGTVIFLLCGHSTTLICLLLHLIITENMLVFNSVYNSKMVYV